MGRPIPDLFLFLDTVLLHIAGCKSSTVWTICILIWIFGWEHGRGCNYNAEVQKCHGWRGCLPSAALLFIYVYLRSAPATLPSIDHMSLGDTVLLRVVHIVTPPAGCIPGMLVAKDPAIYNVLLCDKRRKVQHTMCLLDFVRTLGDILAKFKFCNLPCLVQRASSIAKKRFMRLVHV